MHSTSSPLVSCRTATRSLYVGDIIGKRAQKFVRK